eukprot:COSAG01_NODE_4534_length_4945_cov_171.303756_4_plen_36_part_00
MYKDVVRRVWAQTQRWPGDSMFELCIFHEENRSRD